jgi:hypothetical protein
MTGINSEAGTTNFSGPPEFTPGVLVAQSLVFCVVFCFFNSSMTGTTSEAEKIEQQEPRR